MRNYFISLCFFLVFANAISFNLNAQELEPRALTALPKGLNFGAIGYAFASGNTLLDPALPLKDFNGNINTLLLANVKSIDFFGKSGKIDAILPFAGSLEEFEKLYITKVLNHCNWKIAGKDGSAVILGLPPSTLRSKMKKLGITLVST